MTTDRTVDFLVSACQITGDRRDFLASADLVEAFEIWQRDHGCQPVWGSRASQLQIASKAFIFQLEGRSYWLSPSTKPRGYLGIRLAPDTILRLADVRTRGWWPPATV